MATAIDIRKREFEESLFLDILNSPKKFNETEELVLPDFENFDETFSKTPDAILINHISLENDYMQTIVETICDNSKKISLIPSCDCGNLQGEFYQTSIIPIICPKCKSTIRTTMNSDIKNDVWIDIPVIFRGGVIQPAIFKILADWLKVGKAKTSFLHLILDPKAMIPEDILPYINGKGFNYLYENFDYIMNFFLDIYPKTSNHQNKFMIKLLLEKYRDRIWCTKLPILSSVLQPITKQGHSLKYVTKNIQNLLNSIVDLIDIKISEKTSLFMNTQSDKVMYDVYAEFLSYTSYIVEQRLGSKPGLLRQHTFGTRLHMSFRAVITPITGEHYGDEIHIPWKIGLNTYKYYLISVLTNRKSKFLSPERKYTMNEAYNKIMRAFSKYDFEIDQIFQTLIEECPFKGFPVLFNRNPSLRVESIQELFATCVKPGIKTIEEAIAKESMLNILINDETIGFSGLIVKGPNADLTLFIFYIDDRSFRE